jgi:hypothetical protein
MATCHQPAVPTISVAGRISPTTDAANIMPAQNPIIMSLTLWLRTLKVSPMSEPMTDAQHSAIAEIQTDCMISLRNLFRKNSQIKGDLVKEKE